MGYAFRHKHSWVNYLHFFVVGSVFNIIIIALGAYVHASRSSVCGVFGKFYQVGGKLKPVK
jgi:V/A-type H+-transporting ATPase subunit I